MKTTLPRRRGPPGRKGPPVGPPPPAPRSPRRIGGGQSRPGRWRRSCRPWRNQLGWRRIQWPARGTTSARFRSGAHHLIPITTWWFAHPPRRSGPLRGGPAPGRRRVFRGAPSAGWSCPPAGRPGSKGRAKPGRCDSGARRQAGQPGRLGSFRRPPARSLSLGVKGQTPTSDSSATMVDSR